MKTLSVNNCCTQTVLAVWVQTVDVFVLYRTKLLIINLQLPTLISMDRLI